jgi:hypothetical protein
MAFSSLHKVLLRWKAGFLFLVELIQDLCSNPGFHIRVFREKGALYLRLVKGLPLFEQYIFSIWCLLGTGVGVFILMLIFVLSSFVPYLRGLISILVLVGILNGPRLDSYLQVSHMAYLFRIPETVNPDQKDKN